MIRLTDVVAGDLRIPSIEVHRGSTCTIITGSGDEQQGLLEIMLGVRRPSSGEVMILDQEVYAIREEERVGLFRRVGVVQKEGGLISNLKVWENIILPFWYHMGRVPHDVEGRAVELCMALGIGKEGLEFAEYVGTPSGLLPPHEKMLIGVVRAMLMEPDLMIYDSLFDRVNPEVAERFANVAMGFHAARPERTSVYMSPDERSLCHVKADAVVRRPCQGVV